MPCTPTDQACAPSVTSCTPAGARPWHPCKKSARIIPRSARPSVQPSFAGITAAPNPLQIPGYGSLGDIEAQFLELSMDLGCSPGRISSASWRMSARISAVAFGRPAGARDCHFQKSRNPARCQPTTVSGLTATKTSAHRDQTQRRIIQNSRSN